MDDKYINDINTMFSDLIDDPYDEDPIKLQNTKRFESLYEAMSNVDSMIELYNNCFIYNRPSFSILSIENNYEYYKYDLSKYTNSLFKKRTSKHIKSLLCNNINNIEKPDSIYPYTITIFIKSKFDKDDFEKFFDSFLYKIDLIKNDILQYYTIKFVKDTSLNEREYFLNIYDILKLLEIKLLELYDIDFSYSYYIIENTDIYNIYMFCYLNDITINTSFITPTQIKLDNKGNIENLENIYCDIDELYIKYKFIL